MSWLAVYRYIDFFDKKIDKFVIRLYTLIMMTIDNLLHDLVNNQMFLTNKKVDQKVLKTLNSLSKQIKKGLFLTEKQAKLAVNLLKEISRDDHLSHLVDTRILDLETWSCPFRVINVYKKIYFEDEKKEQFIVEFTYDKDIKTKLFDIKSKTNGNTHAMSPSKFSFSATEKNIGLVLDCLAFYNFEIDKEILYFYKEIKKIQESTNKNFDFFENQKTIVTKCIENEIKDNTANLDLILLDRRIRYQYMFDHKIVEKTLTSSIASRLTPQVWIDKKTYTLENVFTSLSELSRFPALLIFNKNDTDLNLKILKTLVELRESSTINNIGIYFRTENSSDLNKNFNTFISKNNLNLYLDSTVELVGLTTSHLPKFLLRSEWYPKTVISFTTSFKTSKTATYCNFVDLVIYYTDNSPLFGVKDEIM